MLTEAENLIFEMDNFIDFIKTMDGERGRRGGEGIAYTKTIVY